MIDEARLEQLMESTGMNRWAADRWVYVADAALLLDQACGRLIRKESDRGMVAVLDPRLLSPEWSAFTYHPETRHEYVKPLIPFGAKFNDISSAADWLSTRRAQRG